MSWISDALDSILEAIKSGAGTAISKIYTIDGLNLFGVEFSTTDMSGTIQQLTDFSKTSKMSIYTIGASLNSIVVPVALSLLTLFFMISLIKRFTEIEKVSWERLLLWGCYFFLIKSLVEKSYSLLTIVMNIVNGVYTDISARLATSVAQSSLAESIVNTFESMNSLGDVIVGLVLYLILAIPFIGSIVQIWAQVLLRVVKLMLCMAFSPIPISMAVEGETFRGKAISYFMYSAGVGFESIVILIGSWIYTKGMADVASNGASPFNAIIGMLIMNALFIAVIQLSHEFSERIFGRS